MTNNSDAALDDLQPGAKIGRPILGDVMLDGTLATATIDDQNVVVTLLMPLSRAGVGDDCRRRGLGSTSGTSSGVEKVDKIATADRWILWLSGVAIVADPNLRRAVRDQGQR